MYQLLLDAPGLKAQKHPKTEVTSWVAELKPC